MPRDVSDQVMISAASARAWDEMAARIALMLRHPSMRNLDLATIPDERIELMDDGFLKIILDIPSVGSVSMVVPPGEWKYRQ